MKKKYKLSIYILSIVFFSRLFFYPSNIDTRFSAGIIVINFLLLVEKGGFYKKLISYSALFIFLERILFFMGLEKLPLTNTIDKTYPIIFYYLTYIASLTLFKFEKIKRSKYFYRCGVLFLADFLSVVIELFIRGEVNSLSIRYVLLVSSFRVVGAFLIYLIYKYRVMIITNEVHQEKYLSLNLMVSSLEAELFYLKKSSNDIEKIMKKAHSLYEDEATNSAIKEECLDIAREVHEVKKDYLRIVKGMEQNLLSFKKENSLTLSKLREIILENTKKYIESSRKDIDFIIEKVPSLIFEDYHKIFILVNNLVVNSIDAITETGTVILSFREDGDRLIIKLSDTGKGIPEKNLKLLFNAGFTTKYNEHTGEMNTGLGLSHVKNIVENLGGTLEVKSIPFSDTTFTIGIPLNQLIKGEL